MEISKLQRLAELKLEINKLEIEAKEIHAIALQEMLDTNTEEFVVEGLGKLQLRSKAKWTYPEALQTAEAALKASKKEAEQLGTATNNPTKYTQWNPEGDKVQAE